MITPGAWFVRGRWVAALAFATAVAGAAVAAPSLEQAVREADTKAEHNSLALRYEEEAEALRKKSEEHRLVTRVYELSVVLGGPHCEKLANSYELAAAEAQELAALHRRLARQAPE